jgi:hypothetical protein
MTEPGPNSLTGIINGDEVTDEDFKKVRITARWGGRRGASGGGCV